MRGWCLRLVLGELNTSLFANSKYFTVKSPIYLPYHFLNLVSFKNYKK